MTDAFDPPAAFVGVDFSGAENAGRKVWVARAEPADGAEGPRLLVTDCLRAEELPGGAARREVALPALVAWLAAQGRPEAPCVAGLDFPFGLHATLAAAPDLRSFILGFAARHPTPEAMQATCAAAGREGELKRDCDRELKTPFAPQNLRLYRQTWHGIAQVLAPLCTVGARVAPIQGAPGTGSRTGLWLLETCPASTLKRSERYRPYKSSAPKHRAERTGLLDWLRSRGVAVPPAVAQRALDDADGDALDSLICAEVAWRAWRAAARGEPLDPPLTAAHRVEGYVYA